MSSKRTYGTGQRAYLKFSSEFKSKTVLAPFVSQSLNNTELHLAFYMAFLILKPTITKSTTIIAMLDTLNTFFTNMGAVRWSIKPASSRKYTEEYRIPNKNKQINEEPSCPQVL